MTETRYHFDRVSINYVDFPWLEEQKIGFARSKKSCFAVFEMTVDDMTIAIYSLELTHHNYAHIWWNCGQCYIFNAIYIYDMEDSEERNGMLLGGYLAIRIHFDWDFILIQMYLKLIYYTI